MDSSTMKALTERESVGEGILTDKWLLVDYDRRRQRNREALTKLRKEMNDCDRVWLQMGDIFVKLLKETASRMIDQEQETVNAEIEKTRMQLKEKVSKLECLEGRGSARVAGLDLNPVNHREILKDYGGGRR